MSSLKEHYKETIRSKLQEEFKYPNVMITPKLVKIVISMGLAEETKDKNALQDALEELKVLSGQKPVPTLAKKSIASFKLRKGMTIGAKVTLRGDRMFEFFTRFIHVVSPRIRDFRGFPRKCDGKGNYSVGITDQQIFPEINLDKVKAVRGMRITFVTTATTNQECEALLSHFGMPFKKKS